MSPFPANARTCSRVTASVQERLRETGANRVGVGRQDACTAGVAGSVRVACGSAGDPCAFVGATGIELASASRTRPRCGAVLQSFSRVTVPVPFRLVPARSVWGGGLWQRGGNTDPPRWRCSNRSACLWSAASPILFGLLRRCELPCLHPDAGQHRARDRNGTAAARSDVASDGLRGRTAAWERSALVRTSEGR
jgi:hypothetical protein